MSAALLSEPPLLARHRRMLLEKSAGPHKGIEAVAGYIRGEQRLGRVSQVVSPEAISAMLLGACFQRAWIQLFLDQALHGQTMRRFVVELVGGIMHGLSERQKAGRAPRRTTRTENGETTGKRARTRAQGRQSAFS